MVEVSPSTICFICFLINPWHTTNLKLILKKYLHFLVLLLSYCIFIIFSKLVLFLCRGVFRNLYRGGLHFQGGLALVGARNPPEINRFHWSRGDLASIAPPTEYAPALASGLNQRVILLKD